MRIAILSQSSRPVGGLGTYLRLVIPALVRRGDQVGLWHESGGAPDGDPFTIPAGSPSWPVETMGLEAALAGLRAWRPDVLFSHGLSDPEVEMRTLAVAPAVFLAHGYYGTCISGAKAFKMPTIAPCTRTFGWPCLAHYYPRRCGGWHPVTMVREFRRQGDRLALLPRYRAIITLSRHMQQEYVRHGLDATCLQGPADPRPPAAGDNDEGTRREWRLLFVGRMDSLKGGQCFLAALPRVTSVLTPPLDVMFIGDGPARASWAATAAVLEARAPRVRVTFSGWLDHDGVEARMAAADLLVLPSLWPEPFGLVGLEAARQRLPVAAFAVGGIPQWLRPGVNGHLARADPPTPVGLADAIIACLKDAETHARLREGALRVAAEFTLDRHVDALTRLLNEAAGNMP